MPLLLLSALKYILIGLIWLFFIFAIRAVWRETRKQVRTTVSTNPVTVPVEEKPVREPNQHSAKGSASVFVVEGPYAGITFDVTTPAIIGRDPSCQIVLTKDSFVSQKHAEIYPERRHLLVSDLGSRNGTLVNGDPIDSPIRVSKGDVIQIGKTALRVVAK